MTLADLIQQPRFESPAQEAVLNVLATEAWLSGRIAAALAPHGATPAQFNVLRTLRGHHPAPMTCSDIARRLPDRTPGVTRLLTRLEHAGLITRTRAEIDAATRHLSADDLATLSRLLERLREDQT